MSQGLVNRCLCVQDGNESRNYQKLPLLKGQGTLRKREGFFFSFKKLVVPGYWRNMDH